MKYIAIKNINLIQLEILSLIIQLHLSNQHNQQMNSKNVLIPNCREPVRFPITS